MSVSNQPDFKPFPLFTSCHLQTIAAAFLTFSRTLSSLTHFVSLPDGEQITYEVSTPPNWKPTDPTVVMVHGLCGSHRSSYIVRLAKKLYKRNLRTIRINLRGCGTGKGYAKRVYNTDGSNDLWHVFKQIKEESIHSPIIGIGFSFGGNLMLKMAGEWEKEAKTLISKIIAINPPIDMDASVQLLSKNKLYERYFMHYLRLDVMYRHRHFEDLPPIKLPSDMTLLEFNEFYIAPEAGYTTIKEYHDANSSMYLIHKIQVDSYILFAKDDPIVDCNVIENIEVPENIEILITQQGGHLGYLGVPGQEGGFYWMDSILLNWIEK